MMGSHMNENDFTSGKLSGGRLNRAKCASPSSSACSAATCGETLQVTRIADTSDGTAPTGGEDVFSRRGTAADDQVPVQVPFQGFHCLIDLHGERHSLLRKWQ